MLSPYTKDSLTDRLHVRTDPRTAERIAVSAATSNGMHLPTDEVSDWLRQRRDSCTFQVKRVAFSSLINWSFENTTGNLVHSSGRFFAVEGIRVQQRGAPFGDGPAHEWSQPVLWQPEVGILGILAKNFNGVLHFLMQAKMEPGNPRFIQLSPTVQATRSNYTRAHGGNGVPWLEYFTRADHRKVITDTLQSEHGAWFYHKANRNMIVETNDEIVPSEDFQWLTLGQLNHLLHRDNLVNMDARSVMSCLPREAGDDRALLSDTGLLSWFTQERTRRDVRARRIDLASVPFWRRSGSAIEHSEGNFFRIVAVSVVAGNREATRWTQPLLEPTTDGISAFLIRTIGGVRHVLVHARVEGGLVHTVELAPTVQCTADDYEHLSSEDWPPFLELALDIDNRHILYDAIHSEEGGRFLNAQSRYLLIDADGLVGDDLPKGYAWAAQSQLSTLVRYGHYLNVQARTLLACLHAARDWPGSC